MKTTTTDHPTLKTIRKAFEALSQVFYSETNNWAEYLCDECAKEERAHRGFGDDFHKYHPGAASVRDVARAFAVLRVAEYLLKPKSFPRGKDYLHYQRSCFTAAGIVDEFGPKVREAWKGFNLEALAAIDYCQLVGKAA